MDLPLSITIIVILLLLSAFFSGTETAFSCANKVKLKTLVSQGKVNAKAVYDFADEKYDKLVTVILIGNNIVNLAASSLATLLFTSLIADGNLAATVSTVVLTVAVLVVGEITPKYLASMAPEKFCFFVYPLMQFFYWILLPLEWIFGGLKRLMAKIFRLKKDNSVTDEELLSMVEEAEESGTLKEDESELVRSALEFDDLKVEDILVPRVDVYAVEEQDAMEEVRSLFEKTGYSRLPVYKDTIDNVIGLIHERDFYAAYVRGEKSIDSFVQDIVFTTEYTRISALLKPLQKNKIHMAAVSDEYGGLVGIVTLEDILEELVGEIWDEHDEEEVLFGKIADKEYWVDGKCELREFFALYDNEELDEEFESNTVGGWVTEVYGEIPPIGEVVRSGHFAIKIVKATKQKVLKIRSNYLEEIEEEREENEK